MVNKVKNSTFFAESEDILSILKSHFGNLDEASIKKISTGWTNIVFEVKNNSKAYIVRFPRNNFFSKQIQKDVIANNFLKNNLRIKTVNMQIAFDNGRPFSIHEKIDGIALTERIDCLNSEKINSITKDIAEFYLKLHNFPKDKIPNELKVNLSDFLVELSKVDDNYYDYSSLLELKDSEKNESVLVHGDLNIGNVLLDKNDDIIAFIDFAFCGLSDRYSDLARISCRVSEEFLDKIIYNYEKFSGLIINKNILDRRNKMWKYIEEQYIIYMKNSHPEIILPEGC